MWFAAIPWLAAQATPQSELLRWMDDADADPVVAVSCQPVAPLVDVFETVRLPGFDPSQAPMGSWVSLLAPGQLQKFGVALDEPLTVVVFEDQKLVVDVGFSGTERQASALVAALLGLGSSVLGKFGWEEGRLVVGGRRLPGTLVDVTWQDDRLTVRAGVPEATGATALRSIVDRTDRGTGCAIAFRGDLPRSARARAEGRDPTPVAGHAHLPLADGAPATLRFRTHHAVPTSLTSATHAPVGGTTVERPAVLLSIGASLGDLLLDPTLRGALHIDEQDVVETLSRVRFGPGTTVAFFADEPKLGFVANLDVTRADGRAIAPRRARRLLQRVLRRGGIEVVKRSATELRVALDRSTVWVATRPEGVVVGSDAVRVAQVAHHEGADWVGPPFAALAQTHPVAMRSVGTSDAAALPPVTADLGIRTHDRLWEVTFAVHVEPGQEASTHTALVATIGALLLPRLLRRDGVAEDPSP